MIASVDPGTEVERTVRAAGAGLAVPPEDPERFIAAVRTLVDDPAERNRAGQAGRAFVEQWASPDAVAQQYDELFVELRGRARDRRD